MPMTMTDSSIATQSTRPRTFFWANPFVPKTYGRFFPRVSHWVPTGKNGGLRPISRGEFQSTWGNIVYCVCGTRTVRFSMTSTHLANPPRPLEKAGKLTISSHRIAKNPKNFSGETVQKRGRKKMLFGHLNIRNRHCIIHKMQKRGQKIQNWIFNWNVDTL